MSRPFTIPLLVFLFLIMGPGLNAADVFLGTSRESFQKMIIGIIPFEGGRPGKTPKEVLAHALLESVLREDLKRSQLFQVADLPVGDTDWSQGVDTDTIHLARGRGMVAMVWAELYFSNEKWVMEAYAYEAGKGEAVIRSRVTADNVRALAHRFSDKLVAYFTGEQGFAETKIAYLSNQTGSKEVYLMDYDGANETKLTTDRSIILSPRWSFDATQIGYTSYRNGSPDVYFLELSTGNRTKIFSSKGLNFSPAWAPQGDRIVFASTRAGNAEIYMTRPDGTGIKRLTFHPGADLSPVWSPTGREIAFTSDRGGSPQIYIMDADGSNVRRLTYSGNYNTSAAWAPQGDWVAYTCRNDAGFLKVCADRIDGQQSLNITEGGAWDDESPSWAANGREVVFTSNRLGKDQIFAIRPDGTGLIRLTSNGGSSPAWAPR